MRVGVHGQAAFAAAMYDSRRAQRLPACAWLALMPSWTCPREELPPQNQGPLPARPAAAPVGCRRASRAARPAGCGAPEHAATWYCQPPATIDFGARSRRPFPFVACSKHKAGDSLIAHAQDHRSMTLDMAKLLQCKGRSRSDASVNADQNLTPATFLSSRSADSTNSIPANGSRLRPKPTHCGRGRGLGLGVKEGHARRQAGSGPPPPRLAHLLHAPGAQVALALLQVHAAPRILNHSLGGGQDLCGARRGAG